MSPVLSECTTLVPEFSVHAFYDAFLHGSSTLDLQRADLEANMSIPIGLDMEINTHDHRIKQGSVLSEEW